MLPYDTIGEAEAAIGRGLTFAESLWFHYSGNMSDYLLYCHSILFLFLAFSLAPIPFVWMELRRSNTFNKYKIQPKVKLTLAEVVKCYKDVLRTFFLVVGPLQLVSYPSIKMIQIRTGLPLPSGWEIICQLLVYFLIEDYTNYWIHRFLHSNWAYHKIHHVHHEFTAPTGFAAPYAHWAEILVLGIPSFLGPALVPGHMITFWFWVTLRQIEAVETHCGKQYRIIIPICGVFWYDFPWTPMKYVPFYAGAEYHDYHHYVGEQSHSNFGSIFTYCDYLYGTDKGNQYHKRLVGKLKEESRRGGIDQKCD